jgi:hypothetical protein
MIWIYDKVLNILPRKQVLLLNKRECKVRSNSKNLILETIHSGVLSDEIIQVEVDKGSMKTKIKIKITYYDREKRTFEFISNLFEFRADTIAALIN